MKYFISILIFVVFALGVNSNYAQVNILYTSNLNGALMGCNCPGNPYGGIDRIIGTIKLIKKKEKNVIVVDSGDFFGTYPDTLRDQLILAAYNNLPYDIVVPGDQEFIYGIPYFRKRFSSYPGVMLKGNLEMDDAFLKPYYQLNIDGLKITFLGWHSDESFSYIKPQNLKWKCDIAGLKKEINKFKKISDIVILVSHAGHDDDIRLVQEGIKPDIIISGHSQDKYFQKVDSVLIVQAGMDAEGIGKITLSRSGEKIHIKNQFIPIVESSPIDVELRKNIRDIITQN